MPDLQLIYLITVIAAFSVYALVLAWGVWRTRDRGSVTAPRTAARAAGHVPMSQPVGAERRS